MQVLYHLALNAGETVTRQELLNDVWQGRVVVDEALTRTISQLRIAFNDNKAKQIIQTVPKKGYRLVPQVKWVEADYLPRSVHSSASVSSNVDTPENTGSGTNQFTKPSLDMALATNPVSKKKTWNTGYVASFIAVVIVALVIINLEYKADTPVALEDQPFEERLFERKTQTKATKSNSAKSGESSERRDNVEANQHFSRGNYWLMNGKTSEWFYKAEAALQQAIENDPDLAAAHGRLAYIYARHNYHDVFMARKEAETKAQEAIGKALALQPNEENAKLAQAILFTSYLQFDKAKVALDSVLAHANKANKESGNGNKPKQNSTALYLYSEWALAQNDVDAALQFAQQAKAQSPLSPWVNVNLAMVHYWRGEFAQALQATKNAISVDPKYTWAYVWQAKIYQQQGQLENAINAMLRCMEIDDGSKINSAYLGLLFLQNQNVMQAEKWFEHTASLYGDSLDARFWQGAVRFIHEKQAPELMAKLLPALSLLDTPLFSLLPNLVGALQAVNQQAQGVDFIQSRYPELFHQDAVVNHRNIHAASAFLALSETRLSPKIQQQKKGLAAKRKSFMESALFY